MSLSQVFARVSTMEEVTFQAPSPSPDVNYLPTLGAVELIGFSWSAWYETFLHTWLILSLLCVAGDADPIHVLSNNLNRALKCVSIKAKNKILAVASYKVARDKVFQDEY